MGQAKNREKALRLEAIAEMDRWIAPPTPEETDLAFELSQKEITIVPRLPSHIIEYMRMEPQKCHENCNAYRKLDPEGKSKVVLGWWRRGTSYVSHSIIERDGSLVCITPYPYGNDPLEFIVDTNIVESYKDGMINLTRLGKRIPLLVRLNPDQTILEGKWVKARLEKGLPLSEAMLLDDLYRS